MRPQRNLATHGCNSEVMGNGFFNNQGLSLRNSTSCLDFKFYPSLTLCPAFLVNTIQAKKKNCTRCLASDTYSTSSMTVMTGFLPSSLQGTTAQRSPTNTNNSRHSLGIKKPLLEASRTGSSFPWFSHCFGAFIFQSWMHICNASLIQYDHECLTKSINPSSLTNDWGCSVYSSDWEVLAPGLTPASVGIQNRSLSVSMHLWSDSCSVGPCAVKPNRPLVSLTECERLQTFLVQRARTNLKSFLLTTASYPLAQGYQFAFPHWLNNKVWWQK